MAVEELEETLPQWDMDVVFPGLESKEFKAAFDEVASDIASLKAFFDESSIRRLDEAPDTSAVVGDYDRAITSINELFDKLTLVNAYIGAFVTTDSRNDLAQAKDSELENHLVELSKLRTRLTAWVGSLNVDELLKASEVARQHEFAVRRAQVAARHQMSELEEDLSSSLAVTGGWAWAKLHGNVTSRLMVKVDLPDGEKDLPMSAVRGLAHDPDPAVRSSAFKAELAAWEKVSVPLAAALNSIKGEDNTLNERRGWADSLEPALFSNNVDRRTLDAMQQACTEAFPDFRRYLKAKAKLLGKPAMAFWDIFAPVGGGDEIKHWPYREARDFIIENFASYSDRMAGLARRAFDENWIDAGPRLGKRDGAFCMDLRNDESRILSNYEGSFDSVQTLAHELGHAYHNLCLAPRTPVQRSTPMALAETASIFCQTIINNAALAEASDMEKLGIIEGELQDSCQVVVDIHSRFIFEKGVYEGRRKRELSVEELNSLMLEAQKQTYGEGLDSDELHPYMWAVKGHYYGAMYYNWPYTFGLLFGLGLYRQYQKDPDGFKAGYDDLLSSTGLADAADLCARFGFDIRTVDFWRSSLDVVRDRVTEFENLVG